MEAKMNDNLIEVDCSPECGFMIRSHNRGEIKRMTKDHMKMIHNTNISDKDVEGRIQPAMMTA